VIFNSYVSLPEGIGEDDSDFQAHPYPWFIGGGQNM
jgi:hypothetical protein